jgi:hypothetical protein
MTLFKRRETQEDLDCLPVLMISVHAAMNPKRRPEAKSTSSPQMLMRAAVDP